MWTLNLQESSSSYPTYSFILLQLIVDCLVLHYPHSRHFLQNLLSSESLQAIDLELRIPEVFQGLWRFIDLLE